MYTISQLGSSLWTLASFFKLERSSIPSVTPGPQRSERSHGNPRAAAARTRRDASTSTKGGVISLTKSPAREFATHHVRVDTIAPAGVRTDRIERFIDTVPEAREVMRQRTFGLIEPREIAYAAVFLASGEPRSITGQILAVNGGLFD